MHNMRSMFTTIKDNFQNILSSNSTETKQEARWNPDILTPRKAYNTKANIGKGIIELKEKSFIWKSEIYSSGTVFATPRRWNLNKSNLYF